MVSVLSNCIWRHSGLDVITLKGVTRCESIIGCQHVQYPLCPSRAVTTAAQRRLMEATNVWMVCWGTFCFLFCKDKNGSCCVYGGVFFWRTLRSRIFQRCSVRDTSADLAGHGKTWTLFCCAISRHIRAVCGLVLSCWKIPHHDTTTTETIMFRNTTGGITF